MKKLLLTLILTLISTSAMAEWTMVDESSVKDMVVYVDYATIRTKGNLVKMWALYDYKTMQESAGDKYLSEKSQYEYDCLEEQIRTPFNEWFSENMGKGEVVYTHNNILEWAPVPPGSIGETLWKVACGKK